MFGAARFVAAGVTVALFGGILLAGVLTQPSDELGPAAVTDSTGPAQLLPGIDLVTEEVERGVFRVLDDGVRDLAQGNADGPYREVGGQERVLVGQAQALEVANDGSVWRFGPHKLGFYRLGDEAVYRLPLDQYIAGAEDIEVTPDGRVLFATHDRPAVLGEDYRLWTLDGGDWRRTSSRGLVEVGPDGSAWNLGLNRELERVEPGGRVSATVRLPEPVNARDWTWEIDDRGHQWLISHRRPLVWEWDGTSWTQPGADSMPSWPELGSGFETTVTGAVTSDGTVWLHLEAAQDGESLLARLDDRGWQVWGEDAGAPHGVWDVQASPDGSIWVTPRDEAARDAGCAGRLRFDGETWTSHLGGHCVGSTSVGPDGSLWALARTPIDLDEVDLRRPPAEVFVVTPAAFERDDTSPLDEASMRPDEDPAQAQASAPTPREEEMRLQTPMATALAIATMAAAPAVAAAQADDAAAQEWTYLTWTLDDGAAANSYGTGSGRSSGLVLEASDPRASGVLDLQYNANAGGAEDQPITLWEFQLQLANEEGAWSGTGSSVVTLEDGSDDAETSIEPWRLQGSGAYDGLTLLMVTTNRESDQERWGFIVPTAEVPKVPDPVPAE